MSKLLNIQPLIEEVRKILLSHELERKGSYKRWKTQGVEGKRDLGRNPYGCADAANILYTIGSFPSAPEERASWIAVLQEMQDPGTGLYTESTHHTFHTTAHCVAALELFDVRPRHTILGMHEYLDRVRLENFLDQLDWRENPWSQSHQGAGLFAALAIVGEARPEWMDWYFEWLAKEADSKSGFWRKGCVQWTGNGIQGIFPHLAGTFHYLFNHEYARRPFPYPARTIDSCLRIYRERKQLFSSLGRAVSFAEIDWVYCLNRSLRHSGYRYLEVKEALGAFAEEYIGYLMNLSPASDEGLNDLHRLFGMVCCLAELQVALPGLIRSDIPLKLVLDRRPFI